MKQAPRNSLEYALMGYRGGLIPDTRGHPSGLWGLHCSTTYGTDATEEY